MSVNALFPRRGLAAAACFAVLVTSSNGLAQQPDAKAAAPDAEPPTTPTAAPSMPSGPAGTLPDTGGPVQPATLPKQVSGRDLLAQALAPSPNGLQPEDVARRGAAVSPNAATKKAELRAASARVDQAVAAYFPKATVGFAYTRLSKVDLPPEFGAFTPLLNSYQFTASLSVPLSDYLLRLTQAYATVALDVDGKRFEQRAAELQASLDAKIAYYNWILAYGQGEVATLAVQQVEQHLRDAELTLRAGLISRADVLRIQSQKAQALYLTRAAQGLQMVTEQQLRLRLRSEPDEKLQIGIDIMALPPNVDRMSLPQLQKRALANRLEIKALGKAKASLEEVESINRAGMFPRVDAVANAVYGNPNQRIFPPQEKFNFTWDLGVRVSWTINDTFTTLGATAEANAQVQAVDAQLTALKDGIIMAVTAAYNDLQTAKAAIVAAEERERASAAALELRRRLLLGGKATATEIVDADTELTQARLQRVTSHVDAHVAYAKLEHAVGGFDFSKPKAKVGPSGKAAGPRRSALAKPRPRRQTSKR